MNLKNTLLCMKVDRFDEMKTKVLDNEREYTPILKPRNIFKIKNDSFVGRQHLKNS